MTQTVKLVLVGLVAGIASGMFGIGGGVVMVPLLVMAASFDQHHAHATSLAAGMFLAAAGAIVYVTAGDFDLLAAVLLAVGAIAGAPIGARLMHRIPEAPLKVAFGFLLVGVGIMMALR